MIYLIRKSSWNINLASVCIMCRPYDHVSEQEDNRFTISNNPCNPYTKLMIEDYTVTQSYQVKNAQYIIAICKGLDIDCKQSLHK